LYLLKSGIPPAECPEQAEGSLTAFGKIAVKITSSPAKPGFLPEMPAYYLPGKFGRQGQLPTGVLETSFASRGWFRERPPDAKESRILKLFFC
jgi:hypothetical protein